MNGSQDYIPSPQHVGKDYILIEKFPIARIETGRDLSEQQNEIDYNRISEMWDSFDQKLWEPLLIDTEHHLLDGQHRIELAKMMRLRYIDVIIKNDDKAKTLDHQEKSEEVRKSTKLAEDYELEQTTVWDFPERGSWATHKPDYRGNFAPHVARNIILNYSQEGELVLDPMAGSGTTLIEARLLNRNAIGYDINQNAVEITKERLNFSVDNAAQQTVSLGDVRNLSDLEDNSIDLILTHPPYANIITYSDGKNPNDLSSISSIDDFLDELEVGFRELFRVLKPDKYCAILIGDTRKAQHYVPLSFFVLQRCLKTGFALKEQIIKLQHNCRYTKRWSASAKHYKFYLIMHEHLFVFRKPHSNEKLSQIRYSVER